MSMSGDDHISKTVPVAARRIEVFTGAGRRREWSGEQKAAIVAESYVGEVSVCDVARRHGLTPSQLFSWRRDARRLPGLLGEPTEAFVPAVVDTSSGGIVRAGDDASPLIGFDLNGASVWVCHGADAGMVTTIIQALKGGR